MRVCHMCILGLLCAANGGNKYSTCRRESARCFVSLNILLSHSRSLKVIQTGTIGKLGCSFTFDFHSNYGSFLYQFRDKARYWSKIIFFLPLAFDAPVRGVPVGIMPCCLVWKTRMVWLLDGKKTEDTITRFDSIHERDRRTDRRTELLYQYHSSALLC